MSPSQPWAWTMIWRRKRERENQTTSRWSKKTNQRSHGEKQIWWDIKKLGFQGAGSPVEPGNPKGTSNAPKSALISTPINVYEVQNNNNLNTKYNQNMSNQDTNLSPKKKADQLRLLIVNFQSILGRKEEIELMLSDKKNWYRTWIRNPSETTHIW